MNTAQSSDSLSSPPKLPRPGPSLRTPLLIALVSFVVTAALGVFSFILAGPHLFDILQQLGSSASSDAQTLQTPIRNILSPGMLIVGFASALSSIVFFIASLWLFIGIIMWLVRR